MVSILESIKTLCGIFSGDEAFDNELIMHINAALGILTQLGIGPNTGYLISNVTNVWTEFLPNTDPNFSIVKNYVYTKVRLIFDPPQNSFLVKALEDQLKELEWRIELNTSIRV